MKIIIEGTPKEIADLELALKDGKNDKITNTFFSSEIAPSEMRTLVQKIKDDIKND